MSVRFRSLMGRHRRLLEPIACALIPGGLMGVQLAGLLFFLNPHLPFTFSTVARATAFYVSLLAAGTLVILLPFTWMRARRARRLLPWTLVIAFASSALVQAVHASHFSFFLPAGINRRLLRAALWLSLAAIVTFYTALLHNLKRRRYGWRSGLMLVVIAVLSVYVVLERREAYRAPAALTPRPASIEPRGRPNLLVVGIGAATLDVVLPLAERRQLPFFASMLEDGAYGRLESLEPTVRDPLWMSIATGKLPFRHGVLGAARYSAPQVGKNLDFRLLPVGLAFAQWGIPGGRLPAAAESPRRVRTLWEILSPLGFESWQEHWPGSLDPSQPPPLVPPPLSAGEDRVTPASSSAAELSFSNTATLDQYLLESALRRLRAAQEGLGTPLAGFFHLPGLEEVSETSFGAYYAQQFEGRTGEHLQAAVGRLANYYADLDTSVANLWAQLPEPRLMVVVSAYGVRASRGLERLPSTLWPERSLLGRTDDGPDGLLLLRGRGIRSGQFLSNATLTDIAPTVLYALGFPVAADFDGRVLTEAFSESFLNAQPLTFVPSYESLIAE